MREVRASAMALGTKLSVICMLVTGNGMTYMMLQPVSYSRFSLSAPLYGTVWLRTSSGPEEAFSCLLM